MFQELEAKVEKMTNASNAIEATLDDINSKLKAIVAGGGLSPEAKAKLTALTSAIDKEGDDLIAANLRNTAAEEPPPPVEPPGEPPVTP